MDNAQKMRAREPLSHVVDDVEQLVRGEGFALEQDLIQAGAADVLKDKEDAVRGIGQVEQADNVGVGELSKNAGLTDEGIPDFGLEREFKRHAFERDIGVETTIVGEIDFAHAAAAENAAHFVTIGDETVGSHDAE